MAIKIISEYFDEDIKAYRQKRICSKCKTEFDAAKESKHAKCRACTLGTDINMRRSSKKK